MVYSCLVSKHLQNSICIIWGLNSKVDTGVRPLFWVETRIWLRDSRLSNPGWFTIFFYFIFCNLYLCTSMLSSLPSWMSSRQFLATSKTLNSFSINILSISNVCIRSDGKGSQVSNLYKSNNQLITLILPRIARSNL